MALIPASQADVLSRRLASLNAEYGIRRDVIDQGLVLKDLDGQLSIDLAGAKATADVELNELKQGVQREVAQLDADVKLELAGLSGLQQVELAQLGADLGIERAIVIGEAMVTGKSDIATQKASNRIDLANLEGAFKQDIAALNGEFKVVISQLEADNRHAVAEIRRQSILNIGALEVINVQQESNLKIQLIDQRALVDITTQSLADSAEADGIRLSGSTSDSITLMGADLDASFTRINASTSIGFMEQESNAEVVATALDATVDIRNISAKLRSELEGIAEQSALESTLTMTLAEQDAASKLIVNQVRIGSVNAETQSDLEILARETVIKGNHITNMMNTSLWNREQEAAIEISALTEEGQIKRRANKYLQDIKVNSAINTTNARAAFIKSREAAKVANEGLVTIAENAAGVLAAEDQAIQTALNAQLRISELATMSLADYLSAINTAKARAASTKALAAQDSSYSEDLARQENEVSMEAFDITTGYEATVNTARWIAERFLATATKKSRTVSIKNTYTADSPSSNYASPGSPPIFTIYPPTLLEAP